MSATTFTISFSKNFKSNSRPGQGILMRNCSMKYGVPKGPVFSSEPCRILYSSPSTQSDCEN
eukprot:10676041-Karenia_brevis.AAC.1